MKRAFLFLAFSFLAGRLMADSKLSTLTQDTTAQSTDLMYKVDDPSGTPTSRAITFGNVITSLHLSTSTGYSVEPATVTFLLNKGMSTSTETITTLSPGVMHIVAASSNVATGLVSLSTEVTGVLPLANMSSGATYYIQNTSSFQPGSVFNVSSASVTGPLIATGINVTGDGGAVVGEPNLALSAGASIRLDFQDVSQHWAIDNFSTSFRWFTPGTVRMVLSNTGLWGIPDPDASSQGAVKSQNSGRIAFTVRGAASQSSDLEEWQDSGANVLLKVTSAGIIGTSSGNESTGSGTALLGGNCPASTLTAPYTWLKFTTSDGSTVYVPAWK